MSSSSHHPSSYRPHLVLMMLCVLALIGVVGLLVVGWKSYFLDKQHRQELEQISRNLRNRGAENRAPNRLPTFVSPGLGNPLLAPKN